MEILPPNLSLTHDLEEYCVEGKPNNCCGNGNDAQDQVQRQRKPPPNLIRLPQIPRTDFFHLHACNSFWFGTYLPGSTPSFLHTPSQGAFAPARVKIVTALHTRVNNHVWVKQNSYKSVNSCSPPRALSRTANWIGLGCSSYWGNTPGPQLALPNPDWR